MEKKSRKKLFLILALSLAGILLAVVLTGLFTNWFGLYGPATKVALAAGKMAKEENFTLDLYLMIPIGEEGLELDGQLQVSIDREGEHITAYGQANTPILPQPVTLGIYQGKLIYGYAELYRSYDISSWEKSFFAEKEGEKRTLAEMLQDTLSQEAYAELEREIYVEKLEKNLFRYFRKLNSDRWLKQNMGYTRETEEGITMYRFQPDLYRFLTASIAVTEDLFRVQSRQQLLADLEKDRAYWEKTRVKLGFGVANDRLIYLELAGDGDKALNLQVSVVDLGKTQVDTDALQNLLTKVK